MNVKDVGTVLREAWKTGRQSIYLQGPPGIGKTAVVAETACQEGYPLISLALPTCEAVDVRGLPVVESDRTVWRSPFPKDGRGVLLLDELSSAPQDVQVAAHHLVWAEAGSDMALGPEWRIVATGNRSVDRTVYRPLGAPLRNRLLLVSVEPDMSAWSAWALESGIRPEVLGFLRWRPELLSASETPLEGAFPSPRAWTRVSQVLTMAVSSGIERELLIGTIGEGATIEFAAYLQLARQLPDVARICADPKRAPIPESPGILYALTSALSLHTLGGGPVVMSYLSRLPAEYGLLYIRDVRDKRPEDLRADLDVQKWVSQHRKLFLNDPL